MLINFGGGFMEIKLQCPKCGCTNLKDYGVAQDCANEVFVCNKCHCSFLCLITLEEKTDDN